MQFYICLVVFYKIICFQLFIFILLSVLIFYVFVNLPSVSLLWRSKTLGCMLWEFKAAYSSHQWWLWPPDLTIEGNKRVRYIQDFQKVLTNPCFRKQSATLANLVVLSDFCSHTILPLKFLQMISELLHSFAVSFTSSYNSHRCITAIWNVAIQQFECSIVTEICIYFRVCHRTPLTNILKTQITVLVRKSDFSG